MMLPGERELTKKLAGRPFTILGINSDQSRSALKEIMKKQEITWPNIWDGMPNEDPDDPIGKIARRWNISGWPTIFVLDHKGVIRHRDLREKELDEAVIKLVDEAEKDAKH